MLSYRLELENNENLGHLDLFRPTLLSQHHNQLIQNLSVQRENLESDNSSLFDSVYGSSEIIKDFAPLRYQSNVMQPMNQPTPPNFRGSSNKGLLRIIIATNQLEEDWAKMS
ncbi:unnamed protein product [Lepeophtheirus salmonis]|uniref:(salmon louse) hypothetical protein n=1 Tax=Lepeophtheirus salmonis TaxID=72036 RepID=A0A7R8D0A5_LEPSM|nr:unnamed protein product [Lepeophtheirus salmonis]CAF2982456.1 unnamed protein product [Lepeophtheirus salmonis]